eukprot:gene28726-32441_t
MTRAPHIAAPGFIRTADGVDLFYRDWDQPGAEPVLFVGGWSLPSDAWNYQMLALHDQGLRVIAFDRRGHGRSSDPGRGYDVDTLAGTTSLTEFRYANMGASALMQGWFNNKCLALAQCTLLSTADRAIVNSGANLVNWLRGEQTYANDEIFRAYSLTGHTPAGQSGPVPIVLGDIASSKPAYLREPRKGYPSASPLQSPAASRAFTQVLSRAVFR